MTLIHITNANFEEELTQKQPLPLIQALERQAIFLQLQFLPFLYAGEEDCVGVTAEPPAEFWEVLAQHKITPPKLCLLGNKNLQGMRVEAWGASRSVASWAKEHGLEYAMPPWEVVCKVNSKRFSFDYTRLHGSALIQTECEAADWLQKIPGPKVFKTCFGVSGRGHFLCESPDPDKLRQFLQAEFREGRPVVAQPWVERTLDFSTQWKITEVITYLGATLFETDSRGVHKQNTVGEEKKLFGSAHIFLEEHKRVTLPILNEMKRLGYFGNVGIDAMVYEKDKLEPVVEINARKTMGWAALEIQKRHFPQSILSMHYTTSAQKNLLPSKLMRTDGSAIRFNRVLTFTLNSQRG